MSKDGIVSAVIAAILGGSPALVYVGTLKSDVQHLSVQTKELTDGLKQLNETLTRTRIDVATVESRMCSRERQK